MVPSAPATWERGRFDLGRGPREILFGRMYEDVAIEEAAFPAGTRVFCIASAGCTAMQLAASREVVAVDINPVQLAYAADRGRGAGAARGVAERFLGALHTAAPLVGWSRARVNAFLDLDDPAAQLAYWRRHLDTWRFRAAIDSLLSLRALRTVYASPLLSCLPPRLGAVMRRRIERSIGRFGNRSNPYARFILLGEPLADDATPAPRNVRFVHADAAELLERSPAGSFGGFTLSNILDGADPGYARRLFAAVRRAAAPGAMVVLRSFSEPLAPSPIDRAADDRSMIWGRVEVTPA